MKTTKLVEAEVAKALRSRRQTIKFAERLVARGVDPKWAAYEAARAAKEER